jgi:hypothetical protein
VLVEALNYSRLGWMVVISVMRTTRLRERVRCGLCTAVVTRKQCLKRRPLGRERGARGEQQHTQRWRAVGEGGGARTHTSQEKSDRTRVRSGESVSERASDLSGVVWCGRQVSELSECAVDWKGERRVSSSVHSSPQPPPEGACAGMRVGLHEVQSDET